MSEPEQLVISIPPHMWPGELLNVNKARGQTRYLAHKTAPWRELGAWLGRQYRNHGLSVPVRAWVEFRFPTNHRRDTPNLYPTAKALIDGLVIAKVISDDCDGVMEGPFLKRIYPNGPQDLRIVIQSIPPEQLGKSEASQ